MIKTKICGMGNAGKFNYALNFDGSNDYIYLGDVDSTSTSLFSIAAWVKWNSLAGHRTIFTDGGYVRGIEFGLYDDEQPESEGAGIYRD